MVMDEEAMAADEATTPVLTREGWRATIRLNRPEQHNRLEPDDLAVLAEMFAALDGDPAVRVLVLTGTGRTFSSGYHLGALERQHAGATTAAPVESTFGRLVDQLEDLGLPTICALNGGVYGGATDLALACDFRIGVAGLVLRMPAVQLGLHYYGGGLRRYVTRLGLGGAKKLFLTAATVESAELSRIGYLDEVVPPEALSARVDALAGTLAAQAPAAVRGMKQALNRFARAEADAMMTADQGFAASLRSRDAAEGLAAWRERRVPVFRGT